VGLYFPVLKKLSTKYPKKRCEFIGKY